MKGAELKKYIRNIPDFPKTGILFRDITTLLKDKDAFRKTINLLAKNYRNQNIDAVVAVEARGFILGGAVAHRLGAGFIPVRKKGKLPYETYSATYELEYGTDTLEIHKDAFKKGERVLILDDLLATGGTTGAVIELIKKLGGEPVEAAFVIELEFLSGRGKIKGVPVFSLVKYDKE